MQTPMMVPKVGHLVEFAPGNKQQRHNQAWFKLGGGDCVAKAHAHLHTNFFLFLKHLHLYIIANVFVWVIVTLLIVLTKDDHPGMFMMIFLYTSLWSDTKRFESHSAHFFSGRWQLIGPGLIQYK